MGSPFRVGGIILAIVLIAISQRYLDIGIALFSEEMLRSHGMLASRASDIPDLLLPIFCVITCASWLAYFHLERRGGPALHARFFLFVGWTIPVAFFLKSVLKYMFGMINTRAWLAHRGSYGFHWFHGGSDYSGFPSGHMVMFTVLMIAIGRFFPRLRLACLVFLLLLAAALLVTDYHFLSDVIAGFLLGILVDVLVHHFLVMAKGGDGG